MGERVVCPGEGSRAPAKASGGLGPGTRKEGAESGGDAVFYQDHPRPSRAGAPGERGPGFYMAYFRDLDGNKFCACRFG